MTIATKNAATDASLARAVRQILGDGTEQWLAEQGMERLRSALHTGHSTAPEPRGSSFVVRLEAWRTLERTCLAWPNGNVHTWLSGLVDNAEAFSDLFENLGNVQTETEQLALARTRVTSVTMPEGRTLRWCERHRTSIDIETAHTSIDQQGAESLPLGTRATGSQAVVRLGQAVLVTRTVTVTDKRRPPVKDIAAMAHGAASIISPTRWEPAAPSAIPVRYATWVEVDNKRHQAPPHTRLFRQYNRARGTAGRRIHIGRRRRNEPTPRSDARRRAQRHSGVRGLEDHTRLLDRLRRPLRNRRETGQDRVDGRARATDNARKNLTGAATTGHAQRTRQRPDTHHVSKAPTHTERAVPAQTPLADGHHKETSMTSQS